MTKERRARPAECHVVHVAVQGLLQSEYELCHTAKTSHQAVSEIEHFGEASVFFFEKKNQKTFARLALLYWERLRYFQIRRHHNSSGSF
jgi:hypothetical protein